MRDTLHVGIHLGADHSSIAYLNESKVPMPILGANGQRTIPSVVAFKDGAITVGANESQLLSFQPDQIIRNPLKHLGLSASNWQIDGKEYTAIEMNALILRHLLTTSEAHLRTKIKQAVIAIPPQFSHNQCVATAEAGHLAGLKKIDIISEPVAATLGYVLGEEGIWFAEMANDQTILVLDLRQQTFEASLVRYQKDSIQVRAGMGDLHLGTIDFQQTLLDAIADQYHQEVGSDPRQSPENMKELNREVDAVIRSLRVRSSARLTIQTPGRIKVYQIERTYFEKITLNLVDRIVRQLNELLKSEKMGWARIDTLLLIGESGGISNLRERLQQNCGRTSIAGLSPDQTLAHGAACFAGMLKDKTSSIASLLTSDTGMSTKDADQPNDNSHKELGVKPRSLIRTKLIPEWMKYADWRASPD